MLHKQKNRMSCGFCGSIDTGENISNCIKRTKYRREFCEYIVSKSDEGNIHLINCLPHDVTLSSQTYPDSVVSMSARTNRGKHTVIYNVCIKQQVQPLQRLISNMLLEICYINKQGEVETLRRTVCGEEFESMIHVMRFRTKKISFMMPQIRKKQVLIINISHLPKYNIFRRV